MIKIYFTITLFMLFFSIKSNGQQMYYPRQGSIISGWGALSPRISDSICKKRGHVWKDISPVLSYFVKGQIDTVHYPVKQDSYIKDEKDTSFRVTPLIWNYSCERCKNDSTSIKKEIIWFRKP